MIEKNSVFEIYWIVQTVKVSQARIFFTLFAHFCKLPNLNSSNEQWGYSVSQ